MFTRYRTKRDKSLNELIRIVPPGQLLKEEKRQQLIDKIQEACVLEAERFNSLCLNLIHNII